jgi:hypothetical protein
MENNSQRNSIWNRAIQLTKNYIEIKREIIPYHSAISMGIER